MKSYYQFGEKRAKLFYLAQCVLVPWSGRYGIPHYSYSFYKNGKLYRKDSTISVEDTLYHLGDSVDIIYLESIPSINACVSLKSER